MPMQKVEFEFPEPDTDADGSVEIVIEGRGQEVEKPAEETKPEVEAKDDSLDIEVVDDTPPKDRGREPSDPPTEVTEDELKDYSDKVRKRIQHFSKGFHDQRRAAEAAARERDEAVRVAQQIMEENKRLKATTGKSQEALLEQAKKVSGIELEQAKQAFKEAYEAGNADELVKAQEALTTAKLKAERVANIRLPSLQEQNNPVQQQPIAPEPQVDPRAIEWQKANQWFGDDDEMTSFALGLHQKLVKEGVNPQTDNYYERINARMRQVFPDKFPEERSSERDEPKRKPAVVAPATRSTAPNKIVLTKTQVALAKRLGVPLEEYAKQVAIDMRKQNG